MVESTHGGPSLGEDDRDPGETTVARVAGANLFSKSLTNDEAGCLDEPTLDERIQIRSPHQAQVYGAAV
jgi:hypothetical protein